MVHFFDFERVDDPHGDIANQQEGHHLTTRFIGILRTRRDASPLGIRNKQQLQNNLTNPK